MVYEIVWSDVIKRNLRQVLNYLQNNASEKVAQKYITDLEKRVSVLTTHPESGMPSQKNPYVRSLLFREEEENDLPQMKKLFFLYVWLNLTRIAELRK